MHLKFIPAILLVCALMIGCSDDSDNPTNPGNQQPDVIWPLADGNYWTFTVTYTAQDSSKTTATDSTFVQGPVTGTDGHSWYAVTGAAGLTEYYRNTDAGVMRQMAETEFVVYPYPAQAGDSVMTNIGSGPITMRVLAVAEQVTVPAGTFTCYKYYYEVPETGVSFTNFLAPGVGLVKGEYRNEIQPPYPAGYKPYVVSELTSYHLQ